MKKLVCFFAMMIALSSCGDKGKDNNEGPNGGLPPLPDPTDVCSAMDDINFMAYCYENFDVNHDGKVSPTEAKAVLEMNCRWVYIQGKENDNPKFYSLKGIQYFSNLIKLDFSEHQVSEFNPSFHPKLESLECDYNYFIATLNLSNNKYLEHLDCSKNSLQTLDASKCPNLKTVDCSQNPIVNLYLKQGTNPTLNVPNDTQIHYVP